MATSKKIKHDLRAAIVALATIDHHLRNRPRGHVVRLGGQAEEGAFIVGELTVSVDRTNADPPSGKRGA